MLKKMVLILVAGGLMAGAAACNTVKGVGRDIESVGQAGDDAMHGH
ncbi:entericidin A/B family lipoprotein [Novosphingobium naphthalenivorans]|nr:entericidin A/B family lipoprotein [Novosphingobium naphthalenivorans]